MRLNRLSIILFAGILFIAGSCKKNYSVEEYTGIPPEVPSDPSIKINTSVAGFIIDENNQPVGGARITAGSGQAFTDEFGYFKISNVLLGKMAGFITITKAGYYKNIRTFEPVVDKETFLRTRLLTKNETGTFPASSGGSATTTDGAKIVFSAGSLISDSTNIPYNGTVHVSAKTIDVNKTSDMQLSAPGDNRGVNTDGNLRALKPAATIVVELTGDNGEKLQLATGKTATLTIPIAASATGATPATIPLWSLNENTGLWKQESTATKNGNAYTGEVSHFSFWEGADPTALVGFRAQVVNTALQPLANVPVRISQAGATYNSRFGYTDANGMINGSIPANTPLILDIVTPCAIPAYSYNFTTANSNLDLGTLTGNLGQSLVTISGTANNCAGQPVTNGYVQTYDGGFYNRINIVNGSFSFAGIACTNLPVKYIVVDKTTSQQTQPQTFNLVAGANNLGVSTACGTSSVSTLTYIFDGVTHVVTEPADTMAAFSFNNFITNIIQMNIPGGGSGSPRISFEISGGYSLGSDHFTGDLWFPTFPSGRGRLAAPVAVTLTEYGNTGGFISGSFSADNVQDFDNASSVHTISVTFRVRRNN